MKKRNIFLASLIVVVVSAAALLVYLFPLLLEFQVVDISLWGFCIGAGCNMYSASSTSGIGGMDCRGYAIGFICSADVNKYCFYTHPFEPTDKCKCEAVTENNKNDISRKYCGKDKKCYSNYWDYDFACAEDIKAVCQKVERVFLSPNACSDWWGSAEAYGFVNKREECTQSWISLYSSGDEKRKKNIFNGFISDGTHINALCSLTCQNCNSTLCDKGEICEYVKFHPSNISAT